MKMGNNSVHYDLYQLRQLTESIFCMRQKLGEFDKQSIEYGKAIELYEELWRERDELESQIIKMCNKPMESSLVVSDK